jgi:hypothetical protein
MPRGLSSLVLLALLSPLPACEPSSSEATASPDDADAAAAEDEAPPADAFEIDIINHCAEKWRYYVAPADSGGAAGGGATAAESVVVPDDEYTFLQPGQSTRQQLRPGDVIWLVNRKGESTATGFQSKAEGDGGRVEINPDCETIKRVRMAPPGT